MEPVYVFMTGGQRVFWYAISSRINFLIGDIDNYHTQIKEFVRDSQSISWRAVCGS